MVATASTKATRTANNVPKQNTTGAKDDKLLEKLSSEAKLHVQRVRAWFAKADHAALQERHELGRELKAIYDDLTKNGTERFGLQVISRFCKAYGWDRGVVYGALAIATAFTEQQITALYNRPMANGRIVPYGHLRALANVATKKLRESLLDKAIARNWTRDELEDAILRATPGQKEKDGRGRPRKTPKDLHGLLRQQKRSAEEFVEQAVKVWAKQTFSLLGTVKKLPENGVTEAQVLELRAHAVMLRQLVAKAGEQAIEADRAAEYLATKLTTKGAATAQLGAGRDAADGRQSDKA